MATKIRIKRGTESQITGYTGPHLSGELAYATNTGNVFVNDGTAFISIGGGGETPTLQTVTDEGNTTTNSISAGTITANNELHLVNSAMRIFRSGDDMRLRTNNSDRMTITSNGNIGIGTTSPSRNLEVSSSGTTTLRIGSTNSFGRGIELYTTGSSTFLDVEGNFSIRKSDSNPLWTADGTVTIANQYFYGGYINFRKRNTTTNLAQIGLEDGSNTYFNTGNVGIGTTAPTFGLDIHKSGNAFRVANSGGFDMFSVKQVADQSSSYTANITGNSQIYSNFLSSYNYQSFSALYARGFKGQGANNAVGIRSVRAEHGLGFGAQGSLEYSRGVESKFSTLSTEVSSINNIYGFYNSAANSGVTINNQYGLYLSDNPVATNNYGVYQAGASFKNIFEGNVGIGTTAPTLPLDVVASEVKFSGSGNMNFYTVPGVSSHFNFYNIRQNSDYVFKQNVGGIVGTSTVIFKGDTGNVGIGTTAPLAKLHIKDGNTLTTALSNTSALIEGFSQSILQVASHSTGYSQLAFGDQDDGFDGGLIYSNASRYLAIEAANVERMRFTSTGNVGIGTTAPTEKLEVVGYAKASTGFKFGNYGLVYDSSNDVNIKNAAYYHINFHTNNTQRMRITNAGDVGIGTSVPTEKLDVIGNIKLRGTNNLTIGSTGSGGDFSLSSGIRGYNFSNNNGDLLRIDSTGNIGIGTTAPTRNLEIVAQDGAYLRLSSANTDTSTGALIGSLEYKSSDSDSPRVVSSINSIIKDVYGRSADLIFSTAQTNQNNAERMRITDTGNVGIGTTAPTEILSVGDVNTYNTTAAIESNGFGTTTLRLTRQNNSYTLNNNGNFYIAGPSGTALFIDTTSNVGIGTTAPGKTLDIRTNSTGDGLRLATSENALYAEIINGNSESFPYGKINLKYGPTFTAGIVALSHSMELSGGYTTGGYIRFRSYTTEVMRMTNVGLGIGTTAPAEKLHVDGNIRTSSGTGLGVGIDTIYSNSVNINNSGQYRIGNAEFISKSANDMNIYQGRMWVANTGNVGIGTTAPTEKLEVAGKAIIRKSGTATPHGDTDFFVSDSTAALSTAQMQILSGNNASSILYFSDTDAYNIGGIKYSHSDNSMHLRVNGSDRMHITSTGNVGIGTTTPSALLEIKSNSTNDFLKLTTGGGGATPVKLIFEKTVNEQGIIEYNRNGNLEIYNTDGDGGVLISGSGSANADMYVNHAGKVGIGTTAPAAKLHVAGEIRVNAGQPVMLDAANNIYAVAAQNQFRLYSGGSPAINVTTSGNVGIGTTAPAYKLDVNGDARVDSYLRFSSAGTYLRNNSSGALVLAANSGYIETGWGARFRVRAQSGSDTIMLYGGGDSYINGGNLGIGTTAPDSKLHVSAASGIAFKVNPNNVDKEWYIDTTNPDHLKKEGNLILNADPTGVHTSTKISFNIDGSNKASINSDGDLGVGTTAQTSKVHVDGTAMRQLRMGTAGGPSSNTDTSGAVGDMAYDDNYFYIKTASGWGRVQLDFGF